MVTFYIFISAKKLKTIKSVAWTPAANFLVVVYSGNAIRRIDAMSGETITLAGGLKNDCVDSEGNGVGSLCL